MATASEAACTHSCDLCGAGCARADLHRPGGTPLGRSAGEGKLPGVCPACQAHSLSELIAFIEAGGSAADDYGDVFAGLLPVGCAEGGEKFHGADLRDV